MDSKKLLAILRAAGVVVGAAASTQAAMHSSSAMAAASISGLEQALQNDPTGAQAPDAFMQLAAKLEGKGGGGG